ncbi:hypothetical protein LPJ64_002899 [Coemansia asiatica]|uniref:Cytochrome c oxidase assembly factor 3 n=1 Tax=Coemansia asiatica TaxID=1052880 RepID=A0A9W8CIN9_9FUNG|nr:hypothetical protein LPJ64_002899 [Coemansia asiatica]KAJ2863554.1 hypothetical protein FB639_005280 [Coemansia asiatica]
MLTAIIRSQQKQIRSSWATTTSAITAARATNIRFMSSSKKGASSGEEKPKTTTYGEYHFRKSIERGRQVYSTRNLLTALGLFSACTGIYFYSLNAVKQEDFSDIPMPPEPTAEERAKFESSASNQNKE